MTGTALPPDDDFDDEEATLDSEGMGPEPGDAYAESEGGDPD